MPRIDIASPTFTYDADDPEGFRCGMLRMGPLLGATHTGASLYEIPPGRTICPYHYEYAEDEWLLVIEGRATLRTPEGEEQIGPRDLVFFPRGPAGAHAVRNDTDTAVRVLMFSNRAEVSVAVYPDSDKIGVWTGNSEDEIMVRRESGVGYYDREADSAS
jgi:uncharacterized cupin superfamily protein